jgi:hypothetical protein
MNSKYLEAIVNVKAGLSLITLWKEKWGVEKSRYQLGGPDNWSGRFEDLALLEFKFRIFRLLAIPNTDYAIPAPLEVIGPGVI